MTVCNGRSFRAPLPANSLFLSWLPCTLGRPIGSNPPKSRSRTLREERTRPLPSPGFSGAQPHPASNWFGTGHRGYCECRRVCLQANQGGQEKNFSVRGLGGGYTSLIMAGKRPDLWAGVSAWVPISDLRAWHRECKAKGLKYAREIELSCGGAPGSSPKADQEYAKRSPLTFLKKAKRVNLSSTPESSTGTRGACPSVILSSPLTRWRRRKTGCGSRKLTTLRRKPRCPLHWPVQSRIHPSGRRHRSFAEPRGRPQ